MQHCDPEALGLVALGEPAAAADAAHLTTCTQCQGDVAELSAVVSAVRVHLPDGPPIPPPPRVWNQVAAQTGVRVDPRPAVILRQANAGRRPSRHVGRVTLRRNPGLLAVAASALLVGAIGGSLVTRWLSGADQGPKGAVVAQAQLAALPAAPTAGGKATVVRAADGEHLVVDVSRLGALDGRYYEVWLIDTSVKQMVAVGVLRGSEGEFVLPGGLDLGRFPVVDISVQEPGNPAHSGKSVLRGTLPA